MIGNTLHFLLGVDSDEVFLHLKVGNLAAMVAHVQLGLFGKTILQNCSTLYCCGCRLGGFPFSMFVNVPFLSFSSFIDVPFLTVFDVNSVSFFTVSAFIKVSFLLVSDFKKVVISSNFVTLCASSNSLAHSFSSSMIGCNGAPFQVLFITELV